MALGAILAGGQALYGLYKSITGENEAAENQARLERMAKRAPVKEESPELKKYYQEALNRYNQNPYQSAFYQNALNEQRRATATSLANAQGRGIALGTIPKLNLIQNSNLQRAGVQAEGMKSQEFSRFGQAAQARASEGNQLFDINQMTPYNRVLQLQQLKTQAANDRVNAYQNMAVQGLGNLGSYLTAKEIYNPDKENGGGSKSNWFKNLFGGKNANNISTADIDVTGSPYGKYNENDFIKYGVGNDYGYKSYFGKKYNIGG